MGTEEKILTEGTRSYRVFPVGEEKNFRFHMLTENRIPGILKAEEREAGDGYALVFDISSRTALSNYCEAHSLKAKDLAVLVETLQDAFLSGEAFLLEPDCFRLAPEEIYVEPGQFTAGFCCLTEPQADWRGQIQELFRALLEKIDYREEKAVQMAYELYHISLQANFPVQRLNECAQQIWKGKEAENLQEEAPEEAVFTQERSGPTQPVQTPRKRKDHSAFQFHLPETLFSSSPALSHSDGGASLAERIKRFLTRTLPAAIEYVVPVIAGILVWIHWYG